MTFESKTELQRLLHKRLEDLVAKRKNIRADLDRLQEEFKLIDADILTINEALNIEARETGQPIAKPSSSNGARLIGLKLVEAIRLLKKENPNLTKIGARKKLKEAGYEFKNKRPGSAIHMAWVNAERRRSEK